jgi:hypothetical protein
MGDELRKTLPQLLDLLGASVTMEHLFVVRVLPTLESVSDCPCLVSE